MTAKIIGKKVLLPSVTVMEGERNVDVITFLIDREYNGIDLSEMNAYANIERGDGSTDKILLEVNEEENALSVVWPIDGNVTAVAGDLYAQISFADQTGETVFATEKFVLRVNSSIDAYEDLTGREPNVLYRLQQTMYNYVDRMQTILNEVNAGLTALGNSGSGGGGGTVIDANHPLSAAYVSGLADVATSGSYSDLIDAPSAEDVVYYVMQELNPIITQVATALTPCILKYVSLNATASEITAVSNYNKNVIRDYLDAGLFVRRILLWDEATDYYYTLSYVTVRNGQATFRFNKGTGYSAIYNLSTGAYGFSE
ncbi:MAG: hypothetical protein J6Z34_03000 [Clostridia bacterium]|nr:hypothetical protein [Clostridia bacterium]